MNQDLISKKQIEPEFSGLLHVSKKTLKFCVAFIKYVIVHRCLMEVVLYNWQHACGLHKKINDDDPGDSTGIMCFASLLMRLAHFKWTQCFTFWVGR